MAQPRKVLRSPNRHLKVEYMPNNRVRIYDHGHLVDIVWHYELDARLAARGLDLDQLIEE